MAAANTDKFKKAKRRFSTTIGVGGFTAGATTLPLTSTSGLDTDTAITLVIEPGGINEEVITGVVNGNNVINCVRGKEGTSDATHVAGAAVSMYFTETHWDDLINGILVSHNQDGTQATNSVTTTSITDNAVTTAKLDSTLQGNISNGWVSLSSNPSTITYNGNRNYDLVFNSVDLTGTLSPNQKLKLTRTVAAPYRSTTLNGTSQYYNKTSPAGFSGMTSAFTAMAWVKLLSYPSANAGAIIGRDSAGGTGSGWELEIDGGGRAIIYARNATGNIVGTSYTAVPLNKWIHIAASLNAATGATAIYFDGVLQSSVSATAGTTIVQPTTDLTIGKRNSGAYYLNAELAQVAVFSSVLTQATIRSYISQGLSGSESTLISAFSFDGSKNDLNTTNANNLTANGSAVETTADSPYANSITAGLQEYAEINSVSYSTNTTVNVRVPETCMIPTSGGITSSSYSTQTNPYGLPAFSNIIAMAIYSNNFSSSSNSRIELTGLKTTAIIPPNKSVKISAFTRALAGTAGDIISFEIHDGSVSGATNMITGSDNGITTGGTGPSVYIETIEKPNTSTTANITKTYVVGTINNTAARSFTIGGDITSTYRRPLFIKVEIV